MTTLWGGYRAGIVHYYACAGDDEYSILPHFDGTYTTSNSDYRHANATNGVFYNDSSTRVADITDGTSHTTLIAETWGRNVQYPTSDEPSTSGGHESRGMNLYAYAYFDWPPNSWRNYDSSSYGQKTTMHPWRVNSFHADGVNVAFADGSFHFIGNDIPARVFLALYTPFGGEVVSESESIKEESRLGIGLKISRSRDSRAKTMARPRNTGFCCLDPLQRAQFFYPVSLGQTVVCLSLHVRAIPYSSRSA